MARPALSVDHIALARSLLQRQGLADTAPAPIPRRAADAPLLLSFAQQRLWFLDQLAPGNPFYNVAAAIALPVALQPVLLGRCLNQVVARHEVLRTHFDVRAGEPRPVIAPSLVLPLPVLDLAGLDAAQRGAERRRLSTEEARAPFDLATGPLLRARLLRCGWVDHVLLLTLHHIVCDGLSLHRLTDELFALYDAALRGQDARLPELPLQYADYALWQRDQLARGELQHALAWWRERLAGAPTLALPTDRPRPRRATFAGGRVELRLAPTLSRAVLALGRESQCTPFMVCLALFLVLLHRHAGQSDLVVGVPVAGRNRTELEPLVGFFVNTLALRLDLSRKPGFRALLGRVRSTVTEALAHQALPFEKLVEELQPERDLARNPLFQAMFQFFSPVSRAAAQGQLPAEGWHDTRGSALFDLALHLSEGGDGIYGELEYSSDLFDAATAQRLARHYRQLAAAAVAAPDTPIGLLALHAPDEMAALLQPAVAAPDTASVLALFERTVARAAGAVAVAEGDAQLDYAALDRFSTALARGLQARGIGAAHRVATALPRGLRLPGVVLGILKAGAACVPLDPTWPPERMRRLLAEAGAHLLITDGSETAGATVERVEVEMLCADATPQPDADPPLADPLPLQLAYVVFTSGSTGVPKAVAIPHQTLSHLIRWQADAHDAAEAAVTAQFAPVGFDVFFQELFATWAAAGRLVVVPETCRRDPEALWRLIGQAHISRLFIPVAVLHALADAQPGCRGDGSSLRRVVTAGEALKIQPRVAALLRELPGCRLENQYGPSETHVVTAYTLEGDPDRWPALPPIGTPIAGSAVYVLDAALQPVPFGAVGAIHIGGAAVGRGYLGRPDASAERFGPDPWSAEASARLYRSGDLGRRRADGLLEFVGRDDEQIKWRGFRVEPGEIEAALARHPWVSRSVVAMHRDHRDEGRLTAWVVAPPAAPSDGGLAAELRAHLEAVLPAWMMPAAFVRVRELPLSGNGKIDRTRLPAPGAMPSARSPQAPATPFEQAIAPIWAEVLGCDPVDDAGLHFFNELGGHSLLATRVVSLLRQRLQVEVPLSALFEAPTLALFARRVEATMLQHLGSLGDAAAAALLDVAKGQR